MSELVSDCPRCNAKRMTFDLISYISTGIDYGWRHWYEAFCICRKCHGATVFTLKEKEIWVFDALEKKPLHAQTRGANDLVDIDGYISIKDFGQISPPEFLPEKIERVFREGSKCLSVDCHNAAGSMFRLCIDLTTKSMLPETDENGLNSKIRRNLGLRLPWLFQNAILPNSLQDLSTCIKEDGNDGAHDGSLTKEESEDLLDFTTALLERIYTEPERLRLAQERRNSRRA